MTGSTEEVLAIDETTNTTAPTRYLGAQVKQWYFPHDAINPRWALSSEQNVKKAVKNIVQALTKEISVLDKNKHFFSTDYYSELDDTALLNDEETNYYQSQVSILRWMVE